MWPGGSADWPWASVYAAHFLTVARADGHPVPDDFYDHLLAYVHRQLDVATDAPGELEVQAYAAYVLSLAGHPDRPAMDRLVELAAAADRPGDLPDGHSMRGDAQLFLASAWLLAGRRDLAEDMLPAAMPPPRTARQHDGNLGSPVRDRAIQVLTLEQVQPDRPDLPDLVQRLADDGVADRWASTQDVAYATLAVGQYLQLQATHHPLAYASAKLLLDGAVLAESRQGTPLTWTGAAAAGAWRVELTGPVAAVGHVGWLQTGVPLTPPPAASHGLTVRRRYLGQDGREVDAVRTGDLVRVELTLDGPADLANVVLEDLLPAGSGGGERPPGDGRPRRCRDRRRRPAPVRWHHRRAGRPGGDRRPDRPDRPRRRDGPHPGRHARRLRRPAGPGGGDVRSEHEREHRRRSVHRHRRRRVDRCRCGVTTRSAV